MSVIDDTRKLLQDLVVPDLKALTARVDGLSSRVDKLEKTVSEGLAESKRDLNEGLAESKRDLNEGLAENRRDLKEGLAENKRDLKEGLAATEQRMAERQNLFEERMDLRFRMLEQTLQALLDQQKSLVLNMQLERRVARIEQVNEAREIGSRAVEQQPSKWLLRCLGRLRQVLRNWR